MGVLDDKVAIVTGSARGIGRATAEVLSQHGAKVLINDLDGDAAEQTASEIGGETAVFAGDLTREGAADELVKTAIDAWGKLDVEEEFQQACFHITVYKTYAPSPAAPAAPTRRRRPAISSELASRGR
jgi:hypothetical protein